MSGDRFTLGLICALAAGLLPARARAAQATPDEQAAMDAQALKAQVDEIRERNLKAKARLFLLQAAMMETRSYAQDPKEAVANAEKAAQGKDEAERAMPMQFEDDELLTSSRPRRAQPSVVLPKSASNPWDPPEPPRPSDEKAPPAKAADTSSVQPSAEKAPASAAAPPTPSRKSEPTKTAAGPATASPSEGRR